ncbi:centrosomal protein of 44 kDa isoform X2 [Brachyhypopomus gauderio]|uniref:centrosomal protein of 44 kDa isoform X2 n=1 Tax=Brachyhypopomus gauderio TaxID=698409 RepID=UPI004042860B
MATGDLKGCLRKLQASLRSLKYPSEVDYQRLSKGDPVCCLPIVSYAFTCFSPALAELLVQSGIELTGKNDLSFTESVYKVLRDIFSYKPLLSKQQFLQFGFAERKISLLCDIINLVLDKHNQLTKVTKHVRHTKRILVSRSDSKTSESPTSSNTHRTPAQRLVSRSDSKTSESPTSSNTHRTPAQRLVSRSDSKTSESPTSPDTHRTHVVLNRPLVERHLGSSSPVRTSFSSNAFPQEKLVEEDVEEGGEPSSADSPHLPAHTGCVSECTLQAVESALRECVSRMLQLDARLQAVEKSMAGKVVIERAQWENLESRVLLLETSLALASPQSPVNAGGIVSLPASGEKSHLTEETGDVCSQWPHELFPTSVRGSSPVLGRSVSGTGGADHTPTALPSASPEETIKERLERIANMMKDTSRLLKTSC